MKNIFITNGHLNSGGCEKSLINLLNSFDFSKYNVDLLLVEDLGDYADEIPKQVNVRLFNLDECFGSAKEIFLKAVKRRSPTLLLKKIIITLTYKVSKKFLKLFKLFKWARKRYDAAIAYRVGLPALITEFTVNAPKKYVWWHHGEFAPFESQKNEIEAFFKKFDKVVCVSDSNKKMLSSVFPALAHKMTVIPNIINREEVIKNADKFNPYENIKDKKILVSLSRFSPEKHMLDTIEAMKKLTDDGYDNLIWYLVGDGEEKKTAERMVKQLGLTEKIVFTGNQKNPYPYIKNADIFIHPSPVESQGMAVIETFCLKKPCVIVHSSGTDEFVSDGVNALQAHSGAENIAEKIKFAVNNADKLNFSASQEQTVRRFSREKIVSEVYNLIENQ